MIRIVLVEWHEGDWRLYRQPQWMAQVRETPEAATRPKMHFDIGENAYHEALSYWDGTSREAAVGRLVGGGAVEVRRG